jgi:CRP-like cAMP-binding protein
MADKMEDVPVCNTCRTVVLDHTGRALQYWELIVIFDIILSLILIPFRIGFDIRANDVDSWLVPDLIMDGIFLADIIISFFKSYDEEGERVTDREVITWRYIKNGLTVDVLSTLPLGWIAAAFGSSHPAFRANRLIRLRRLANFMLSWERNSDLKPSVIGILKSIFVIVYMSHFLACVWHLVTLLSHSTQDYTSVPNFAGRALSSRYIRSFYWALVSLTGYNTSTPLQPAECVLSVMTTLTSIALFGTIIGIFGNLLTNLDASRLYFSNKMNGINDYMKYKKIPDELADDVRDYYGYMWNSGKGLEQNDAVDKLPVQIRSQMNFHTNYHSIRGVYLFAAVQDDMAFMGEIVKALRPRIALPNCYVVKKGEIGSEMFFISTGELNVVTDTGIVVFTLRKGMFFGEIALIYKSKRTASIVARIFSDMYVLSKEEFAKVMRKFPEQSRGIKDIAKQRMDAIDEKKKEDDAAAKAKEDAEAKAIADAEFEVAVEAKAIADADFEAAAEAAGGIGVVAEEDDVFDLGNKANQVVTDGSSDVDSTEDQTPFDDDEGGGDDGDDVRNHHVQTDQAAAASPASHAFDETDGTSDGYRELDDDDDDDAEAPQESEVAPAPRPQTSQAGIGRYAAKPGQ